MVASSASGPAPAESRGCMNPEGDPDGAAYLASGTECCPEGFGVKVTGAFKCLLG
jgi:hypothetical protein